jgi:hypothetical protein
MLENVAWSAFHIPARYIRPVKLMAFFPAGSDKRFVATGTQ